MPRCLLILTAILIGLTLSTHSSSAGPESAVPPDESLIADKYSRLGIADPGRSWTLDEYHAALEVLAGLPRVHLPRFASLRSGELFERLLATESRQGELALAAASSVQEIVGMIRSLTQLYALRTDDELVFDRELLEIRSASLRQTIRVSPTRAEILGRADRLSRRISEARSEEERALILRMVRLNDDMLTSIEDLLIHQFSEIIALGALEAIRPETRAALQEELEDLVPQFTAFLTKGGAMRLATLLRELSALDANGDIRSKLIELVERLKPTQ